MDCFRTKPQTSSRRLFMVLIVSAYALAFASCHKGTSDSSNEFDYRNGTIKLDRMSDSLYMLRHIKNGDTLSEWKIPYEVYQFEHGDMNADGEPEIAVGVIKSTRFFPTKGKRIFIFRIYDKTHFRPLWFGSKLTYNIISFKMEQRDSIAIIHAKEMKPDSSIVDLYYKQEGFGMVYY